MFTENTEYVELFIPKGYLNDDPNILIGINGKLYILPKGKTSKVPTYVKEEYERSLRALEALEAKSEALLEKAAKPFNP